MSEKFEKGFCIKEKYRKDYQQLQKIIAVLEGMGLSIPPLCKSEKNIQEQWDLQLVFPIANEGAQGIRITRDRREGLTIFFTNGFEDRKNQRRIEITSRLKEEGFNVV